MASSLPYYSLQRGTSLAQLNQSPERRLRLQNPALMAMTDLTRNMPITIEPMASIERANEKMITHAIRLLFVVDSESQLLGLITANDILGEKPVKYIQEHGGNRRDILIQDIMTRHEQLQAFTLEQITRATVADVVNAMKALGRQHMLVVQNKTHPPAQEVCGLFSTSQISRQLGIPIQPSIRANSFAEIRGAIVTDNQAL